MDKVAWWSWETERLQSCTTWSHLDVRHLHKHHQFLDASNHGYGTVSYRLIAGQNTANVAFILGKARVTPPKQTTILHLELTAAVLAVRVDKMLRKELELNLKRSTFWTNSQSVLKYIANECTRFHTFVANRISIIRDWPQNSMTSISSVLSLDDPEVKKNCCCVQHCHHTW